MAENAKVKMWETTVSIPTYPVCPAEKAPLLIEKRAYQGSTGKVYPLPVTEKILDEKQDVSYKAVFLENEYLQIMILPELGGRIQRAYDKTNGYDFVYYNHVIKPALVGLTGPWISGGIEFNWPQHHRPSTYSPVDYTVKTHEDGSCTIYAGETDQMYGTKGMAAITLYPGKAYIEIRGQLYNPTDLPQTFLWWANPAVPVNDHTYSVFPPDVNAVMDHGKRAVSTFPIATGEYYKWDYSEGVDISRYKNVKVPTSYMAAHSDYDFIGNYDEEKEAGLLHVADHHVSPGKKQWTWGNGDFGRSWDRNLTDEDGPYIELMTGVFTDNQPDFSWLKPQEEKNFVQYFMPYKGVGRVGNATKDACVSLSPGPDGCMELKVYATGIYEQAAIEITKEGRCLYQSAAALSPDKCFTAIVPSPCQESGTKITVSCQGKKLVDYEISVQELKPVPKPAKPMARPEDMKSTEELYLAARHLEQYRHATYEPADYYLEGLKRDSSDIRLNNGYGLLLLRRGHIKQSISFFKKAIEKQTWKNPNPYSGECCYNLGLASEAAGLDQEAYDAFYKSTWSSETQSAGFCWLACLSVRKQEYEQALEFADQSLIRNWHNMKARNLKAAVLRILGRDNTACLKDSLLIDPLHTGCLYEEALRKGQPEALSARHALELSLDYKNAGLYEDAAAILALAPDSHPMVCYYLGYMKHLSGKEEAAHSLLLAGEACPYEYCFPNKTEEIAILEYAILALQTAPMAHYYLGSLLYDKKQYDAAAGHWKTATAQREDCAMAHRNLAIYYYNKEQDNDAAIRELRCACRLDSSYPRFWLEYDQLAARMNIPIKERLSCMESHPDITRDRDDLYLRYITLQNCSGREEEALAALLSHKFHPWEGGEGKVSAQYRCSLIRTACRKLDEQLPEEALSLLSQALTYPDNLGEGKLPNVPDHEIYYYMGRACQLSGDTEEACRYFQLAAAGPGEPQSVLYYNDQPSDYIFYQGLANEELGLRHEARKAFHQLIIFGEKHMFDQAAYDFFAVSLPEIEVFQEDIRLRNTQYCCYLRALGHLGLGDREKARTLFQEILNRQNDYQITSYGRIFYESC